MIYSTETAIGRTLACMLENSIGEDGVIKVPKALSDYTRITEIKPTQ